MFKQLIILILLLNSVFATNWKLEILRVFDIVQSNYVNKDIGDRELTYGSIRGMLQSLNDPYSRFLEPEKYTEMKVNLDGNFYGVGIHIGMKDNQLTVISPIFDTPADQAGIKSMDKIVSINNETTEKMSLEEAVSKIRGPKGSEVILGIKREGEPNNLSIPIVRDRINIKSVDKVQIISENIGYVRLITFESREETNELGNAIKQLKKKGMQKLILDLRNNGGGLLSNARSTASLFMDNGYVVFTVDRNGNKDGILLEKRLKIWDGPLLILMNGASASASEILAGAVRDNKRGTLVGTTTFGKASVQNIIPLGDGSAVLLTIAKYLTPNGDNIHEVGLKPDIEVQIPSSDIEAIKSHTYEYSIQTDYQINRAIEIIKDL
ncbi:MAG: hypothetical protein A2Y40_03900 [Candidatus Margulisbacteria bacterium GWF2_35_9]|nr:MAG: hypothetical protein A2Y40_03900 [Candidatus Margulisbacteria bacterium GWF2_35_9]